MSLEKLCPSFLKNMLVSALCNTITVMVRKGCCLMCAFIEWKKEGVRKKVIPPPPHCYQGSTR